MYGGIRVAGLFAHVLWFWLPGFTCRKEVREQTPNRQARHETFYCMNPNKTQALNPTKALRPKTRNPNPPPLDVQLMLMLMMMLALVPPSPTPGHTS